MAFEPSYSYSAYTYSKKLAGGQAVAEVRLLPQAGSAIGKVLSVSADIFAVPGEVFTGEARYACKITLRVIYADNNGVAQSMEANAEFTDKIQCEQINSLSKLTLKSKIVDKDIILARADEVRVACVVQTEAFCLVSDEIKYLSSGDEIYTRDDEIKYKVLSGSGESSVTVTDERKESGLLRKLCAEPRVVILREKAGADCLTVEGAVINDICCACEDGSIISFRYETPFSQEFEVLGANDESVTVSNVCISSYDVTCFTSGDDETSFNVSYELGITSNAFNDATAKCVIDAYSVTNELNVVGNSVNVCYNSGTGVISERVEGCVTIGENLPAVDNIYAVSACALDVTRAVALDGKLTLEGVVTCNVLYYNLSSAEKNSAVIELPFSITANANVSKECDCYARGEVTAVNVKIKRANELDVKADITVYYESVVSDVKYVISEISLGEERALPQGAIAVHVTRQNETLWDVAKALSTTTEVIMQQNPNLKEPLSVGDKVILYRSIIK